MFEEQNQRNVVKFALNLDLGESAPDTGPLKSP